MAPCISDMHLKKKKKHSAFIKKKNSLTPLHTPTSHPNFGHNLCNTLSGDEHSILDLKHYFRGKTYNFCEKYFKPSKCHKCHVYFNAP